jgi:hypothetical protein
VLLSSGLQFLITLNGKKIVCRQRKKGRIGMKKRIGEAFMPADAYGRSLPRGVGINLLVPEIEPMAAFLHKVLSANVLYADPDFAALVIEGSPVMLHADHAYLYHKLHGIAAGLEARGAGVEIRIFGCDPDRAEAAARRRGDVILAGAMNKQHGLRECHIIGPSGYVFAPSVTIAP